MFKSCNSDRLEFVCLTNGTIDTYLETVPLKVEEITFWNYQMCLHPNQLPYKEVLVIPSLERFSHLKCVKFYNERIEVEFTRFPPSVERVFFISCVLRNQWLNVCVYRKNLKHLDQYCSSVAGINHVLGFLQQPDVLRKQPSATSLPPPLPLPLPSLLRRCSTRRQRSLSIWKRMRARLYETFSSFFSFTKGKRISPESNREHEIEMSDFVPLYQPNIEMTSLGNTLEMSPREMSGKQTLDLSHLHTLRSIQRLKKSYDILVNENIIQFLIGD
jgi:hypothetical protein